MHQPLGGSKRVNCKNQKIIEKGGKKIILL
jgi:hypothetical protein